MTHKEKPESEKQLHWKVDYQTLSSHAGETCSNCSMFIDTIRPRCTDVLGPIYPGGRCKIWKED